MDRILQMFLNRVLGRLRKGEGERTTTAEMARPRVRVEIFADDRCVNVLGL